MVVWSHDPSSPDSGWKQLEDRIVIAFHDTWQLLLDDYTNGFPVVKKCLLTIFVIMISIQIVLRIFHKIFFSYKRYIKAPIISLEMHSIDPSFLRSPSVSTITIYRGAPPLGVIRRRLIQIIRANPWLTSRLVYADGKYSFKYSGEWSSDQVTDHLEFTSDRGLVAELDYETLLSKVSRFVVGNGLSCTNKDLPLFKVSVIQNPSGFSLVMSLSHCLADGRTFYSLYGMFNGIPHIQSLTPDRVQSFPEECEKNSKVQGYFKSIPFVIRIIYFMFFEPKKPNAQIFTIDKNWVESQKKAYQQTVNKSGGRKKTNNFVSTNDVLVSWWACRAGFDYCMMAVNFRDRIKGVTQNHAGNYSGAMVLYPKEFKSPSGVRSIVSKFLSSPETLPNAKETFKFNCGIATNWTTFYSDVIFNNCKQLRHAPIFLSGSSRFPCTMVLFCPKAGEIAALIGSSKRTIAERIFNADDSPCGEILMKYKKD